MTHLPETLHTDRLILRQFELGDLEPYIAYYTGPRTAGVGGPKPRHVVAERFLAMAGQWALRGYGRYAMTLNGVAIGHVGVMHVDDIDPPEITWTLWDGAQQGNGYATEAARAVLAQWTGTPLKACIAPDNTASRKLAARVGMRHDPEAAPPAYDPSFMIYVLPGSEGTA